MMELLIALALKSAPEVIARLREEFVKAHPDLHPPTDAELHEAYQAAFVSSLAKDDRYLAVHPEPPA